MAGGRHINSLLYVLVAILERKVNDFKLSSSELPEILAALREARECLVSRSINEDPQLYSALFLYEKNEGLLSLSFEREYSIFIKLEQIRKIYEVFDRDRNRLEFLNYMMKKERVIFEREFERLLGEKNGDF